MASCCQKFIQTITCRQPPYPDSRDILVNQPNTFVDKPYTYSNNEILSSKYTILNFVPKNLFEQFQRIANFYFILVMLVQLLTDSPVIPATTIVPIVFVLLVTMIKQGIEDVMRHRSDNEVNMRKCRVLREGSFVEVNAAEIVVGDIVKCAKDNPFPCDLVLLGSSEENGECTVTTANLDGETSLKTLVSYEETNRIDFSALDSWQLTISCTQPQEDLYTFHGSIDARCRSSTVSFPLSAKNLMLRGMVMKNTESAVGCSVYTGQDTKLSLNSKGKRAKYSQVELRLNFYLIAYFVILFVFSAISMVCLYVFKASRIEMTNAWYLPPANQTAWIATQDMFSFIIIYNYLIPISLYVSIEIQKFSGAFFIRLDLEMYDGLGDNRARVINASISVAIYIYIEGID